MKLFNTQQIRACDEFTIANEPITSINLMERAALACIQYIVKNFTSESNFIIFCGKGNNGGDGLAIARHLLIRGYSVKVFVVNHSANYSDDCLSNINLLKETYGDCLVEINESSQLKTITGDSDTIIIDALFGTGINKPIDGICAEVIRFMNSLALHTISIDTPSGLYADKSNTAEDIIVCSTLVLTFQFPKLSFLMAQNQAYVPQFKILDIGLSTAYINNTPSYNYYVTKADIKPLLKLRTKFSHKGNFGHALLLAGAYGKMGAAVLAAKASLRSGAGLVTVHVPKKGVDILQTSVPEAMVSIDRSETIITELPAIEKINAIGIGPGIGTDDDTETVVKKLFSYSSAPLVLDADALNALSNNKTWLSFLPPNSILTPHVKEFDRLTENHTNDFDRMQTVKQFALKHNCILILKGAFTLIAMPDGNSFFNSTGNAGLAKGGSGDTLTGVITGLLARGYTQPQAALIGVYVHGLAADMCLKKINIESLLATDVINKLPKAFEKVYD